MKVRATEQGLTIPKEWLGDGQEFEVRRENDQIIVSPLPESDPIWQLGSQPIALGITDASENHDIYLS
jgi:virulence-associated protein VagC